MVDGEGRRRSFHNFQTRSHEPSLLNGSLASRLSTIVAAIAGVSSWTSFSFRVFWATQFRFSPCLRSSLDHIPSWGMKLKHTMLLAHSIQCSGYTREHSSCLNLGFLHRLNMYVGCPDAIHTASLASSLKRYASLGLLVPHIWPTVTPPSLLIETPSESTVSLISHIAPASNGGPQTNHSALQRAQCSLCEYAI